MSVKQVFSFGPYLALKLASTVLPSKMLLSQTVHFLCRRSQYKKYLTNLWVEVMDNDLGNKWVRRKRPKRGLKAPSPRSVSTSYAHKCVIYCYPSQLVLFMDEQKNKHFFFLISTFDAIYIYMTRTSSRYHCTFFQCQMQFD